MHFFRRISAAARKRPGSFLPTLLALASALTASCGEDSRGPTPPTPPTALAIQCPAPISTVATSAAGALVSYARATSTGGRAPVTIACVPDSGQTFRVGTTPVTCTAQDAAAASASCTFNVAVAPVPQLSRTKFLAFGDSITAGEVTVPITPTADAPSAFRYVVVPAASYPRVLNTRLSQRYTTQPISVVNAGLSGQSAAAAVPRFLTAMNDNQPEVVLLVMGDNDLGDMRSVTAALSALERMAKEARGRGARVFLGTIPPSIQGRQRSQTPELVSALNAGVRVLAAGEGAMLVDIYEGFLPEINTLIGVDGLHPNEAGYAKMAELFFDAIRFDLEVR